MEVHFLYYVSISQLEDNNFKLILDILGKIYRGEVWMYNNILSLYGEIIHYFVYFHYIYCIIHLMEVIDH